MKDDRTLLDVNPLPYEVPRDVEAGGWVPFVRAIGLATITLSGIYLLSALFFTVYYVTAGRFSRNVFHIVPVLTSPFYAVPILEGVNCLRRPPQRRVFLRRGLIVLLGLRVLNVLSDWTYLMLSATTYASDVANVAAGARLGQTLIGALASLVVPATLLWLGTRPALRRAFGPVTP